MKKITLATIILIGMALHGCHKNTKQNIPINAELKAAFNYKPGTYWIYKDSVSGMVDSFYVGSNVLTVGESPIDYLDILIAEENIFPGSPNSKKYYWEYIYQSDVINVVFSFLGNISPIRYDNFINYPFQQTIHGLSQGYEGDPDTSFVNLLSAYTHNGITYNNVAQIRHYVTAPIVAYNDLFYLSADVGFIKMNLKHPLDTLYRVWELQRYNIVK